jgi:Domain of unknown function (DUF222)/HNH endonuclease
MYTTKMCDGDGDASRPALERLMEAIRVLRAAPIPEVAAALRHELIGTRRAIDLLEVQFSLVASEFASTDEGEWQGYVSPIQWMRVECGMTAGAAWKAVCVGDQAPALPLTLSAVDAGPLSFAHLATLAGTARVLRESPTSVAFDERPLLEHALAHDLKRFRDDCAHVRHAHDAAAFRAEQVANAEYRSLDVRTEESGAVFAQGWFDPVGGATVRLALDRLARRCGNADTRSRKHRYADALVELAELSLDAGKLAMSGGQRPHLQVTTTLDTLRGTPGAPAGMLEGAGPIAESTVQRLACDANITRVVMGPDSAVLDVGRTHRLPSVSTRRALRARDGGCAWPGCDREAAWTAAHHLVHWANGGATELENLVLLCHRHHRLVHESGWTLARGENGAMVAVAPVPDVAPRARAPDAPPV